MVMKERGFATLDEWGIGPTSDMGLALLLMWTGMRLPVLVRSCAIWNGSDVSGCGIIHSFYK